MFFTSEPFADYLTEPISKPYPGPYTIPVMLDDVKQFEDFSMSRCTFFTIEAVGNFDDWIGYLRSQDVPFLVFGVTAVLHRPDLVNESFTTAEAIEQLFAKVEDVEGLVVESEHIWFQNFLFMPFIQDYSIEKKPSPLERGAIWRIEFGLFQLALTFQRQVFGTTVYNSICLELVEQGIDLLHYSEEETIAFRAWSRDQIEAARQNYVRQREDESRGVLDYIDDQGLRMAG